MRTVRSFRPSVMAEDGGAVEAQAATGSLPPPSATTFRGMVEQLQVIAALADRRPDLAERVLATFLRAHEVHRPPAPCLP